MIEIKSKIVPESEAALSSVCSLAHLSNNEPWLHYIFTESGPARGHPLL